MIVNQNLPKFCPRFYCEKCDYGTSKKSSYDDHILSAKHNFSTKINLCQPNSAQILPKHICQCGKIYKDKSGLWRHKKVCKKFENINENNINKLIHDNSILQNTLLEIVKQGLLTNNNHSINNSHNTNNSHNKSLNLQFFLNETCKDAMNLSEFVSSIVPTIEDLETTGRLGYAEGVSRIFIKKLNELGTDYRPVHYSDQKREVLYIKENNTWNKETEEKPILTKAIKQVAHKNIAKIIEWQKMYPDCTDSDSRKNDLYLNIVSNSMPGSSIEESEQNYKKIINKITKEVVVDKD
jgi:hypothetical protein